MNKSVIWLLIQCILPSVTWPIAIALKIQTHTLTNLYLPFIICLKYNSPNHLQKGYQGILSIYSFIIWETMETASCQHGTTELPHIITEQAFYFELRGTSHHLDGERQKWIQKCYLNWSNACQINNKMIFSDTKLNLMKWQKEMNPSGEGVETV